MKYKDYLETEFEESKNYLKVKELEKGEFYAGSCRNSDLALWNGIEFIYIRSKFGMQSIEKINHIDLEKNEYIDVFIPLEKVVEIPKEIINTHNRV